MKITRGILGVIGVLFPILAAVGQGIVEWGVEVGSRKQLLIDDKLLESFDGVRWTAGTLHKTGERLIVADRPWEDRAIGGISVVREPDGSYKMWYIASHVRRPSEKQDYNDVLCLATSPDGLHWKKPSLGIIEFDGSKENNMVFVGQKLGGGPCVFRDPNARAGETYKLMYGDRAYPYQSPINHVYGRICGSISADGIRWQPLPSNPIMDWYKDTQVAAFWDPTRQRYVAYLRDNDWGNRSRFRRIARAETARFDQWPRPQLVLSPDQDDPAETDLYTSAAQWYPYADDVYVMFPAIFNHRSDKVEVQLAVSRDSSSWKRVGNRKAVLGLAPGDLAPGRKEEFDSHQVYVGVGLTRNENELWVYYVGFNVGHDARKRDTGNGGVISRAVMRLDGFMAVEAGNGGGTLITRPLRFTGTRLELNVDTGAGGEVVVELLDRDGRPISGFSRADADPISTNSTAKVATWKNHSDLGSLSGRELRLKVWLRDARLFAFQFSGDPKAPRP